MPATLSSRFSTPNRYTSRMSMPPIAPRSELATTPAATAITIAMSTIGRSIWRTRLADGSRRGMGGIKLDEVAATVYDRRKFLKIMGLGASAAALAACGGGAGGTAVATTAAATTAAKPTGSITVYS